MDRKRFFSYLRAESKPKTIYGFYRNITRNTLRRRNDRTTTRFESLWSLPYGVSYNSYLVIDEKSRSDRHGRSIVRRTVHRQYPRDPERPADRLPGGRSHGAGPLLFDQNPAPALPRDADRGQCQNPSDARRILRHPYPHPGSQRGRKHFARPKKTSRSIWRRWFTGPK